jgi:hypothetical protein
VRVFDVDGQRSVVAPAISWATRTTIRRVGARVVCPVLVALSRQSPAIRIAIHPFDMDYPETATQIGRIVSALVRRRRCATYDMLFQAN